MKFNPGKFEEIFFSRTITDELLKNLFSYRSVGFVIGEEIQLYKHASDYHPLKVTSMSKKTPSKSSMKELPSSKTSLLAEATSLGFLGRKPNLDTPRAKLISFINDSEIINRGFNHVSILLVGSSGVGKSSTINHLLNIGGQGVQFARTSSTKSETKITSEFLAFADDPDLEVKDLVLGIVDTPSFNDTDGLTQDACNFYSIKKFFEGHPKLRGCLPNLIFVLLRATDERIAGENSNLLKTLRYLNELSLIDRCHPNVVAVLSFCCSVPLEKVEKKKKVVQDVIFDALKINSPVVVLENDFEEHNLEKVGDFTRLPNEELQRKNLYDACQDVLSKNKDNLGRITFNACFSKSKKIKYGSYEITAKDASKDALSKEEEEFVKYFKGVARGGT